MKSMLQEVIREVLEEKFASKAQQRYFYAMANKGNKKERAKWTERAKEFGEKTDFEKLPERVDEAVSVELESPQSVADAVYKIGDGIVQMRRALEREAALNNDAKLVAAFKTLETANDKFWRLLGKYNWD